MTELKPIFERWAKERFESDMHSYFCEQGYIAALDDKLADVACKFAEWQRQECIYHVTGWLLYDDQNGKEFTDAELFTYFIQHIYLNK